MRFVLCDEDELLTSTLESMVVHLGHEVVGVASTTANAVMLVRTARPNAVIVDLSMGFNTDFDIVDAAAGVGAATIVYSFTADHLILDRYKVKPIVVFKPDLTELEHVLGRLELDGQQQVKEQDRRRQPVRVASGPVPTGVGDAQAFYEALNEAAAGDALVSIDVPGGATIAADTASRVREVLRGTDRLLASGPAVRVYLPGGDVLGIESFRSRLDDVQALPHGATMRSLVLTEGESPAAAFDRLKETEPEALLTEDRSVAGGGATVD
jgi:CheY-like chemotaxis protein